MLLWTGSGCLSSLTGRGKGRVEQWTESSKERRPDAAQFLVAVEHVFGQSFRSEVRSSGDTRR